MVLIANKLKDFRKSLPSPMTTSDNTALFIARARVASTKAVPRTRSSALTQISAPLTPVRREASSLVQHAARSCHRCHVALLENSAFSAAVPHQHCTSTTTPLLHHIVKVSNGPGSGVENAGSKGVSADRRLGGTAARLRPTSEWHSGELRRSFGSYAL